MYQTPTHPPTNQTMSSLLRSPSHESDLSSLSLAGSAHHRVTFANKSLGTHSPSFNGDRSPVPRRPLNIPEIFWEDDGNRLLKSCGRLSDAACIPKSFSTSDISTATTTEQPLEDTRHFVSELALCSFQRCGFLINYPSKLEQTSRSCSTWVAVGELASTSQLPSPHGTHSINSLQFSNNALSASNVPIAHQGGTSSAFSTVDLIRSVNKKVRKNYIRRKILLTYRALERMSESEFNLDRLVASANEQLDGKRRPPTTTNRRGISPGPTELVVPNLNAPLVVTEEEQQPKMEEKALKGDVDVDVKPSSSTTTAMENLPQGGKRFSHGLNKNMTMCDIEMERGRSLSKYERNMMIFNWLHSLVLPLPLEDPPV